MPFGRRPPLCFDRVMVALDITVEDNSAEEEAAMSMALWKKKPLDLAIVDAMFEANDGRRPSRICKETHREVILGVPRITLKSMFCLTLKNAAGCNMEHSFYQTPGRTSLFFSLISRSNLFLMY